MTEDTISNTIASIYNVSEFHVGFLKLDMLFGYFSNPIANMLFQDLRWLGIFLSVILFIMFVTTFIRTDKFLRTRANLLKTIIPPQSAQTNPLSSRWQEVENHLNSNREAEWKFAVIEADGLIDNILKESGYPGENMGERMKNINNTQLVTINDLWEAHKIRNRLAHDPNYFLRYGEAKHAINLYKKTLKELQAL